MSVESLLYSDIKTAIEALPYIRQVDMYNGQDQAIAAGQQDSFLFPCVWINLLYNQHDAVMGRHKVQNVAMNVEVYLCCFELEVPDTYVLDMKKGIHDVLQGLKGSSQYSSLNRSGQRQIAFGGNLPIFQQVYSTTFIDAPAPPLTKNLLGIDVEKAAG